MLENKLRPFSSGNRNKTLSLASVAVLLAFLFRSQIISAAQLLFIACVISFLLAPLCRLLEKKIRRSIAVFIVLAGSILMLSALAALLIPIFVSQISVLADVLPDTLNHLRGLVSALENQLRRILPDFAFPAPESIANREDLSVIAKNAVDYISILAGKIYKIVLAVVLSYFLLSDRDRILLRAELMLPSAWRKTAVRTGNILLRELRLYLRGQATIALTVGVLASLCLTAIGIPSGLLLGGIVGLFNVIPYFGPVLGGIPAVLLALGISWQRAVLTIGALLIVQQIDGLVISPRIMGNITGFSPAAVLLALFLGSNAGGISGMLIAMPVMMSARTLYRVFVQRHEKD